MNSHCPSCLTLHDPETTACPESTIAHSYWVPTAAPMRKPAAAETFGPAYIPALIMFCCAVAAAANGFAQGYMSISFIDPEYPSTLFFFMFPTAVNVLGSALALVNRHGMWGVITLLASGWLTLALGVLVPLASMALDGQAPSRANQLLAVSEIMLAGASIAYIMQARRGWRLWDTLIDAPEIQRYG